MLPAEASAGTTSQPVLAFSNPARLGSAPATLKVAE